MSHLAARIDQTNVLTGQQMQDVKKTLLDIAEDVHRTAENKEIPFPRQERWDGFVKVVEGEEPDDPKNEFRLGLWASQRICYCSLFFWAVG